MPYRVVIRVEGPMVGRREDAEEWAKRLRETQPADLPGMRSAIVLIEEIAEEKEDA